MTKVLDSLHQDHRNMAQLLRALERQLARFDAGETPDYDIVEGVVDYCLNYPETYHHPKEDLIYERLAVLDPAAVSALGDLKEEHETLTELTRRFAAAVQSILQDLEVPRERFESASRDFLRAYWEHMNKEEHDIFPAARRSLSDADWVEIESRITHLEDPVFGPNTEDRFIALRQDILHWANDAP